MRPSERSNPMSNVVWIGSGASWRRIFQAPAKVRPMAEHMFEMRLDRMFAETPAFADAELFAATLEARLNRGWTTRRLLIGGLGLVGGFVGAAQVLSSG